MHYKNGREAKVGDQIVVTNYGGIKVTGVVVAAFPGSETCNLLVQPINPNGNLSASAKECLHVEDAFVNPVAVPVQVQPALNPS